MSVPKSRRNESKIEFDATYLGQEFKLETTVHSNTGYYTFT